MYMSVVGCYIGNTDGPCRGDLYTPCYIITVILIAWGSEWFYLLVIESEDLKVCSKSVLAQELWSYGARTGKGCWKVGASKREERARVCTTKRLFSPCGCLGGAGRQPSALTLVKGGSSCPGIFTLWGSVCNCNSGRVSLWNMSERGHFWVPFKL